MTMAGVRRLVLATLIVGALCAPLLSRAAAQSRDSGIERALANETSEIAAELDERVEAAFGVVTTLGGIVEREWQTSAEYELLWSQFNDALPGDTLGILLVSVPASDLDGFVAAQAEVDPNFTPVFLNSAPPDTGHLFLVATSDDEQPLGADMSSIPGVGQVFIGVEPDMVNVQGVDLRSPLNTPAGQAQLIYRTTATRPDGFEGDLWSVAQIDSAAILENIMATRQGAFRAEMSSEKNSGLVTKGLDTNVEMVQSTTTAGVSRLDLNLAVRTDGSSVAAQDPQRVLWTVLGATLALAALVGLGGSAIVYARRADRGERDARHDELTGLPNRRWVVERLSEQDGRVAILFCDLDRFKVVNDSVGHAAGDDLLIRVSERASAIVGERGEVARFGGDEFIIVLGEHSDVDAAAQAVADELVESMRDPFIIDAGSFRTSMSIGVALGSPGGSDGGELIRAADVALGHAKTGGRNSWVLYDDVLREAELGRLELESELQEALDTEALSVHFQPIVDAGQRIRSYEALVRWNRNGELLSPGIFLPVVEEMGRMGDLGEIVLLSAIKTFVESTGHDNGTSLHVNVDPSQLHDTDFPHLVIEALEEHDLDPRRLILELTEGEWIDSGEQIQAVLLELEAAGLRFAIDDFGSGYSSLARLVSVPGLAEIKIDRSMTVRAMDPRTQAILAGLAAIAHRLGVTLIAEGVENIDELEALQDAGIDLYQGYLFGRPGELTAELHAQARVAEDDGDYGAIAA